MTASYLCSAVFYVSLVLFLKYTIYSFDASNNLYFELQAL